MREIRNWELLRKKYLNGNRRVKNEVLKSLELLYGYHRKSAIRLVRGEYNRHLRGNPQKLKTKPGRKSQYQDTEFKVALRKVWKELDYMCSRNLHNALPKWLPSIEQVYGSFSFEIKNKLLKISSSTIDRILKPHKYLGKGRCGTKPGSMLRSEIPLSTSCWNESEPGFLEGDTVAHCGGSLIGEFIWSLTATDICTTWTEIRPVWHKGALAVVNAISDIELSLPFAMKGWDSDNGGEFINHTLVKYFQDKSIRFTRSRAYHKNDNAHVEQRNYTHVRQLLGYQRIDNKQILNELTDTLRLWSILRNHFYPTRKLKCKIQIGSKIKKIYDKPATPYQRVLDHPSVSDTKKQMLNELHAGINPVLLRKQILAKVRLLLKHADGFLNPDASLQVFGNILL